MQINANNNEIKIYPNPAQNNFTIEASSSKKQTLQLIDIIGKQVLLQTINGSTNIDVSNLTKGIYLYNIFQNQSRIKNGKIIIN